MSFELIILYRKRKREGGSRGKREGETKKFKNVIYVKGTSEYQLYLMIFYKFL
jgi:hypothetical protein